MALVLGIDLGTSYFKLGLFNRQGDLCGLGRVKVPKDESEPGRCELSTEQFWAILKEGLAQALAQAQAKPDDIVAMSYSSQANSFLLLDEHDHPLTPLVLWPDRRAEHIDPKLTVFWQQPAFLEVTGVGVVNEENCMAKIVWFQNQQPEIWSRTARVMTISDYFTFGLTGQYVGDQGTASLLGFWDLPNACWWDEGLQCLSLTTDQLSQPLKPGTFAGRVTSDGAKRLGLPGEIPFAVGSLDHHMAAIGGGLGQHGDFSDSTGTVMVCLYYQENYQPHKNCLMGPSHKGQEYFQLAFNTDGAATLDWYKNTYAADMTYDDLSGLAENVPSGAEGLQVKTKAQNYEALTGFENRTDNHHHGHFVRAIMEQKAEILKGLVQQLCGSQAPTRIIATGGGAKSKLWLQIKSDMIGSEFVATACEEPACLGAAIFAALAKGWYDDTNTISKEWIS